MCCSVCSVHVCVSAASIGDCVGAVSGGDPPPFHRCSWELAELMDRFHVNTAKYSSLICHDSLCSMVLLLKNTLITPLSHALTFTPHGVKGRRGDTFGEPGKRCCNEKATVEIVASSTLKKLKFNQLRLLSVINTKLPTIQSETRETSPCKIIKMISSLSAKATHKNIYICFLWLWYVGKVRGWRGSKAQETKGQRKGRGGVQGPGFNFRFALWDKSSLMSWQREMEGAGELRVLGQGHKEVERRM